MDKRKLIRDIIAAYLEVGDEDTLVHLLIDGYEDVKNIDWLLYDLVNVGYDSDELELYGFDSDDIERMSNRVMHGLGPE